MTGINILNLVSIHAKQHENVAVEGAASGVSDGFVHNLFTHSIAVYGK